MKRATTRKQEIGCLLLYLLPATFALFSSLLGGGEGFVFRDAANWYYPLWQFVHQSWSEGIPRWNPYDLGGVPLVADATSAVFYPPKLLFALPLSYQLAFNLFAVAHWWLAAIGIFAWCRRNRCSMPASTFATICYTLSGTLLAQTANPIYLCSGCWLPWAGLLTQRCLQRPTPSRALLMSFVHAMFVLGGDPQTSYHVFLSALILAIVLRNRVKLRLSLTYILASVVLTALLAAVQILPSMEWSRMSLRSVFAAPRSVYEVRPYLSRRSELPSEAQRSIVLDLHEGMIAPPQNGTTQIQSYEFSVGPWRWIELLWPNVGGKLYPENRRWMSELPMEGRVWSGSLYVGVLPLVLSLLSLRWGRGGILRRWMSWTALLGLMGSMGWFGLGWLLHEFQGMLGASWIAQEDLGTQVGGLHCICSTFLPLYGQFRYPAKWFVLATLAISLLAALGWDGIMRSRSIRRAAIMRMGVLGGLCLVAMVGHLAMDSAWRRWLEGTAAVDPFFGPLSIQGATADLRSGLLQSLLVVACSAALLLGFSNLRPSMRKFIAATLLIVVAIETLFANRWLVATGPLTDESSIAERLLQESPTPRVYRSEPDGWMPAELLAADRSQALTVARNWERATLLPKYHLDFRISMAKAPCSIEPADRAVVWMLAREAGPVRPDGQREPAPALLHSLGVEWVISPGWSPLLGDQPPLPCPDPPSNAVIQAIPDPLPRAWIVRNLRVEDELPDLAPGPLLQRTRDCFFSQTDTRDLRKGAIVETDNRQVRTQLNTIQPGSAENDQVSWTQSRSDQIQVEVKTTAAGLLILRDGYAPGWQALIVSSDGTKSEGTVIRVNRVMRGLFLPAGEHTVILTYWPRSLMWGLWLSGISWLLSGGVWWKLRLDDRKHTDSSAFTVARSARLIKNRRRPHSPLAVFTL